MMVDQFGNPELFSVQLWITCRFNGLLCMPLFILSLLPVGKTAGEQTSCCSEPQALEY